MLRIGIDTGGTFTDFVVVEDGAVRSWKEPSTPDDPSRAILEGLRRVVGATAGAEIIHGSTVATNALLEGRHATVAFVTNRGFEDLMEIGRQARPGLYDLEVERAPAIVPRELRFGVSGRLLSDGSRWEPIDEEDLRSTVAAVRAAAVDSVAICLLHSWRDPVDEEAVAAAFAGTECHISVSSRLVPEYREYERASTAAVNAAVAPVMARYLTRLSREIRIGGTGPAALRVMGSNGGALSPGSAGEEAVRTILSGPAAGVTAARWCGRSIGCERVISFDMGGTSTDVSLIEGDARMTTEGSIAGHPVRVPMIDIHTVGAGGGSIGWRDPGGALKVGPQSAGAVPGPACYGHGGPATVTDANLVLGRLVPAQFLDGRMPLDVDAARRAVEALGRACGLECEAAAEGIVTVAEATMVRAIRVISLYRGYEPADFALMAFGGAGGLHAAALAAALDMRHAVVPANPGVFSALGMTVADVVRDRSAAFPPDGSEAPEAIDARFAALEESCSGDLASDGVPPQRRRFERAIDLRYRGQSWEITLPFEGDWRVSFHEEHLRRFGHAREDTPVEAVTLRVRGVGTVDPPRLGLVTGEGRGRETSRLGEGPLVWRGRPYSAVHYARTRLPTCDGSEDDGSVAGPALVLESGATTLIPPGWSAWLDRSGHLHLEAGDPTRAGERG